MMTQNSIAKEYYQKAKDMEVAGFPEKSIYLYSQAISEDYQFMDAYEARGELLFQSEQYELAIRDFEYLAIFNEKEDYSEKRAICHEKLGNYTKCLQLYLEELLENVNIEAYEKIYNIVNQHPEFAKYINFSEINSTIENYINEERAIKFCEAASENDLDQRNDFFDLSLMLFPEGSKYFYDTFIKKADAEVFRYRFCYDFKFRNMLKEQYNLTEEALNQKYKYNAKRISELNLVYAVQKLNEATIYAQNLEEVNFLDNKVNDILEISNKLV